MSFMSRSRNALQVIHDEDHQLLTSSSPLKRASVALVIRIRPVFPHKPTYDPDSLSTISHTFQESIDSFFAQSWVQGGDPEVLLIKRASRTGDRWTGHIALPGGKRESGDLSDLATSARETREETGLELETSDHCLYVGRLPERIIKTAWDHVPLMVLCPFVYLQMRHDFPALALQPSEVHSAHWTPLSEILSPALKQDVRCDVSERFTRKRAPILSTLIRAIAGQLVFPAVKLKPTESLYSNSVSESVPGDYHSARLGHCLTHLTNVKKTDDCDQPLLLWGLTLGIVADLLELVDRPATSKLWSWPTFSPWDMRFIIWLLNHRFRSRKIRELVTVTGTIQSQEPTAVHIGDMDNTTYSTSTRRGKRSEAGISGMMLLGDYMHRLRGAAVIALVIRLAFGTAFSAFLLRQYMRVRNRLPR